MMHKKGGDRRTDTTLKKLDPCLRPCRLSRLVNYRGKSFLFLSPRLIVLIINDSLQVWCLKPRQKSLQLLVRRIPDFVKVGKKRRRLATALERNTSDDHNEELLSGRVVLNTRQNTSEREREREIDRQTDRQTETERQRQR